MKIITSFIFLILVKHSLCLHQNDPYVAQMKTLFSQGTTCLTGNLYNQVRASVDHMKYYCQYVCSRFKSSGNSSYLASKYGSRGKELGAGSFGVVYKYSRGSREYAIKIPKNFKYKLFKRPMQPTSIETKRFRRLLEVI